MQVIKNKEIQNFINSYFNVDITENTREDEIIKARSFYYYLCVKYSAQINSHLGLANSVGVKNHGSVINALKGVCEKTKYDKNLLRVFNLMESNFIKEFQITNNDRSVIKIETYDNLELIKALRKSKLHVSNLNNEIEKLKRKIKKQSLNHDRK